jgi:hypothetical protein
MPRRWPVTRVLLRLVARRLVSAGLIEPAGRRTGAPLRLTPLGWMRAAELAGSGHRSTPAHPQERMP